MTNFLTNFSTPPPFPSLLYANALIYCNGITLKYRVYLRFYLIKIKSVLGNFGLEKQFKVKRTYFITTAIDSLVTNTPYLNEGKVKFL